MSVTRRQFLETASITALVSVLGPSALAQRGRDGNEDTFSPDRMTIFNGVSPQTFKSLIGEAFTATLDGKAFGSLTLIEVSSPDSAKKGQPVAGSRLVGNVPKPSQQSTINFKLRFQGESVPLKQNTYTLAHPALGKFPLFIVPAGPESKPPTYTAIFNQLVEAARV